MAAESTFRDPTTNLNVGNTPTVSLVTTDQKLQAVLPHARPAVQFMYSLVIFDHVKGAIVSTEGLGLDPVHKINNAEYFFRVPPKVHEMGEPFNTSIVATQNGGKFVESQGSIFKDIKLSGTTGLRPNKLARDLGPANFLRDIPLLGSALGSVADDIAGLADNPLNPRGLPNPDERTGFVEIIFMRNLFRHYSDLKSGEDSGRYLMLWRNTKDADYWVVEPMDFRLMQDSSSPMTYKYSITLKTLSRFDFEFNVPPDPFSLENAINSVGRRLGEIDRVLKSTINTIIQQINRVEGFGIFLQDAIVGPAINVLRGIQSLNNTVNTFGDALEANGKKLIENLNTALRQLRGSSPSGVPGSPAPDPTITPLPPQDPLVNALNRTLLAVSRLLSEPLVRDNPAADAQERVSRSAGAYDIDGGVGLAKRSPANGGSSTSLNNERLSSNFAVDKVHIGESIKGAARRLLGDPGRYKTLILLNNLKAPFISIAGGADVLRPGDDILYPIEGSSGPGPEIVNINAVREDAAISVAEQVFGKDIRLKSTKVGEAQLTDFVVNQSGDLDGIIGIPNVEQALKLKFSTERGQLTTHPKFGAAFPIGRKISTTSFNTFRIQVQSTLFSDPRVENIEFIDFVTQGDVLTVTSKLTLRNAGTLLTKFVLERGSEDF